MAVNTEPQPLPPLAQAAATGCGWGIGLGINAVAGALGALFVGVSPLGGMIYGASSAIAGLTIDWICDKVGCDADSLIAKVAKAVTVFFGSVAFGVLAAAAFGFTIPFTTGILITLIPTFLCSLAALITTACGLFRSEEQPTPARVQ